MSSLGQGEIHKTDLGEVLPRSFCNTKICIYEQLTSGEENLPHTCRTWQLWGAGKADVGNKAPVLHRRCSWVSGGISLFFFFFYSVFCLLLCVCWRLGAFQKIQTPLPREHTTHSTVQHSAGCRTLFVFLVHWAGIFSFHASSITCRSNSKNLYHAHMNTNNLNSHFCFWKFIIIEVGLIKQLYFWNFSQNNQVMAVPN